MEWIVGFIAIVGLGICLSLFDMSLNSGSSSDAIRTWR